MKDTACGTAAATAYVTSKTSKRLDVTALAAVTATIVCGYEVPKAYRAKREAASHFKKCEDMKELLDKYKEHCAGRPRLMFAYKDALYCYTASADNDLCLLVIDFEKKTAEFSKAAESSPLP